MTKKHRIDSELASAIGDVLSELSTELDLHYEDSDIVATGPTIDRMRTLARLLSEDGHSLPNEYVHIVSRYEKTIH